jgi:hypothetical protein
VATITMISTTTPPRPNAMSVTKQFGPDRRDGFRFGACHGYFGYFGWSLIAPPPLITHPPVCLAYPMRGGEAGQRPELTLGGSVTVSVG